MFLDLLFDVAETRNKLAGGFLQGFFGLNLQKSRNVDDGKKQVTEFLLDCPLPVFPFLLLKQHRLLGFLLIYNGVPLDYFDFLISPLHPSLSLVPCEEFQIRAWRASLNNAVELIRLSRMLSLPGGHYVCLTSTGIESPHISSYTKKHELGDPCAWRPPSRCFSPMLLQHPVPSVALEGKKAKIAQDLKLLPYFGSNIAIARVNSGQMFLTCVNIVEAEA